LPKGRKVRRNSGAGKPFHHRGHRENALNKTLNTRQEYSLGCDFNFFF
jgi:hypothetical protein